MPGGIVVAALVSRPQGGRSGATISEDMACRHARDVFGAFPFSPSVFQGDVALALSRSVHEGVALPASEAEVKVRDRPTCPGRTELSIGAIALPQRGPPSSHRVRRPPLRAHVAAREVQLQSSRPTSDGMRPRL